MPYGNINVDTVTTSTTGGVLGAGNASIMKNRIINGSMVIDQRNAGASVSISTDGNYGLDRWKMRNNVTSAVYSVQQSSTAPTGFTYSSLCTVTTAASASGTQILGPEQDIEGYNVADLGWGTASAKTITVSFWVRSSLTGTYCVAIRNSAADRSYVSEYSISTANTWEQKSITIVGETSGTWLTTNGAGMLVNFTLGAGSGRQTTANTWYAGNAFSTSNQTNWSNTSGATFYITGVQLEVGSSATGYEYRQYTNELALCQRYYQKIGLGSNDAGVAVGATTTTTTAQVVIPLRTTMRASPTVTVSSMNITDWQTYTTSSLVLDFTAANRDSVIIALTGSGFTAFRPCFFTQANTSSFTAFSAEL
jgi:hypothetical protein